MLENSLFLHAQTSCCGEILNSNCKHVNNFFLKFQAKWIVLVLEKRSSMLGMSKPFICAFLFSF